METESTSRSIASRILPFAILAVAAWLLLKVVVGVVTAIAWTVVGIAAVLAVLWALWRIL